MHVWGGSRLLFGMDRMYSKVHYLKEYVTCETEPFAARWGGFRMLGYGLLNIPASDPPEIVSALSKRAGFVKLSGV